MIKERVDLDEALLGLLVRQLQERFNLRHIGNHLLSREGIFCQAVLKELRPFAHFQQQLILTERKQSQRRCHSVAGSVHITAGFDGFLVCQQDLTFTVDKTGIIAPQVLRQALSL